MEKKIDSEGLKQAYLDPNRVRIFTFDADVSKLEEGYRKALPKLLLALEIVDKLFLMQDHPQSIEIKGRLLREAAAGSEEAKVGLEVFTIFNGPEGVTRENKIVPLFPDVAPRPPGGTVYTEGITAATLDAYLKQHPEKAEEFNKINTVIERDGTGFKAVPYEVRYETLLKEAAALLRDAADDVPSASFAAYLRSRADALVSGNYFNTDVDFVRSTDSPIDFVIGPLESYEDRIQSKKAFYAGLLCMKNPEESERVSAYISHLQTLENMLPQDQKNAKDMSTINIPVAVVDIIAMSGDYQAKRPGITVGQTLPNDEEVLRQVGRKIFIYKNIIAGFKPNQEVLDRLVDPALHKYVNQRGKTNLVIGHEVSHSLGPKVSNKVEDGKRVKVDDALGFYQGIIEELKSDLLSVYNMQYLVQKGLYTDEEARELYADGCLMRNIPVNRPTPGKDTHSVGNLMKFNYYLGDGSLALRDGRLYLDFDKAVETTRKMLEEVLAIQAAGDRDAAEKFIAKWSAWGTEAEYASKTLLQCNALRYAVVRQPVAVQLLRK